MSVSRRQVLTGIGSATAVGAFATSIATAHAGPNVTGSGFEGSSSAGTAGATVLAGVTLTAGLAYLPIDPTAFGPIDSTEGRIISAASGARIATPPGGLMTPIVLPVGASLREVVLAYSSPAGAATFGVWKKGLTGPYALLNPPGLALANGAAAQTATVALNETFDGQSTYMALMNEISTTSQFVQGMLVGYVPPPQAFVPISPVNRVLDTRLAGGKLNLNEERTVALALPALARAGVINLTVTETEGAGFVAVFPAGVPYPGNSNINWVSSGLSTANGVITALGAGGAVTIRCGGAGRTHVVIDVQGYLL